MNTRRLVRVLAGALLVPGGLVTMGFGLASGNVAAAAAAIYGGPLASLVGLALVATTGVPAPAT